MNLKSEVLIVGGGVIGLATAVQLAERGVQVRLLEQGQLGTGCSFGNAGWLTPCFALPLAMPGLFFKSLKWLLNPESPLYIKPSLDPLVLRWLARFAISMTEKKAQAATEAMVLLSKVSLDLYEQLALEFPSMSFQKKGLLMVAQSEQGVSAANQELEYVSKYQVPGKSLSPDEIRHMEPALTGALKGGVFFPNEAHVEPFKVVEALALKAKQLGVIIEEKVQVSDWVTKPNQISYLRTTAGDRQAETYILASGSWSQAIGKQLKLSIPILGGKGYSLVISRLQPQPLRPLMLIEKKVAITPRENSLRIAGTLELVNQDFSITERRVQAMVRGAREFLPLPEEISIAETWRGLRPCTPDGVPLIGFSNQFSNLALACGHQMLGLQSGFGTGRLLADLITAGHSDLDRAVYNPNRF